MSGRPSNSLTYSGRHILAEWTSADELLLPIKGAARIKYTCVAVSRRYIAFGASTGGLYLFYRDSKKYLQVLANKGGSLTHIAFASNDNLVALCTSGGLVVVWELNVERRSKPDVLTTSLEHKNSTITALKWESCCHKVFIGDDHGKVTSLKVPTSKAAGFFKIPTELILDGDSRIVQLDYNNELLLVSTLTRHYLCSTTREQFWQIGQKPRDGEYGACFMFTSKDKPSTLYCARPGSRIWQANLKGTVIHTLEFKKALAIPSIPICGLRHSPLFSRGETCTAQSVNFPQLLLIKEQYLLSWTRKAVYILDPSNERVILWTRDLQDIQQIAIYKADIYCFQADCTVKILTLSSVEKCIAKLTTLELWLQSAQLCDYFKAAAIPAKARRHLPVAMVEDIQEHLQDSEEFVGKLNELLKELEAGADGGSSTTSSRRSSISSCDGIVRVHASSYQVTSNSKNADFDDDLVTESSDLIDRDLEMLDGGLPPLFRPLDSEAQRYYDNVELVAPSGGECNDLADFEELRDGDIEVWSNCGIEEKISLSQVPSRKASESDSVDPQQRNDSDSEDRTHGDGGVGSNLENGSAEQADDTSVCVSEKRAVDRVIPSSGSSGYNSSSSSCKPSEMRGDSDVSPIGNNEVSSNSETLAGSSHTKTVMTEIKLEHTKVPSHANKQHSGHEVMPESEKQEIGNGYDLVMDQVAGGTEDSAPAGPDDFNNDDSVVISVSLKPNQNAGISKKKKRKRKKIKSPAIASPDTTDISNLSSLGFQSPMVGSLESLQDPWSQPTSTTQSREITPSSSPGNQASPLASRGNTPPQSVENSPTTKTRSFFVQEVSGSVQQRPLLKRTSSLPLSAERPSTVLNDINSISPGVPRASPKSSFSSATSPTLRRSATSESLSSLRLSSTPGSSPTPRRAFTPTGSPSRRSSISADVKSSRRSPSHSPTLRRFSTPTDSVPLSSSPTQSTSVTSGPAASSRTLTSSSEASSGQPSPSSSPTHQFNISIASYMGVPYHTGSPSRQGSNSPKIHVPSLSEVKDSISSKLSKTKAFLQQSVHDSGLIHTNRPPEMIGVRPKGYVPPDTWREDMKIPPTEVEETSLIDYTDLIEATRLARCELAEIGNMMEVCKIKPVLARWLKHLDNAQQQIKYYLSSLPSAEKRDLGKVYKMRPQHKTDVRLLATMCVDLEVFSASQESDGEESGEDEVSTAMSGFYDAEDADLRVESRDCDDVDAVLRASFDSASGAAHVTMAVRDATAEKRDDFGLEMGLHELDFAEMMEDDVAIHDTNQLLVRDTEASAFISNYGRWIDAERARKIISFWEGPRHQTWLSLVAQIQECIADGDLPGWVGESDNAKVKTQITDHTLFTHIYIHISRLYKTDASLAVEFCADRYPAIAPWEVGILCFQGDDGRRLFVKYVLQLLDSGNRKGIIGELCQDSWVRDHLVDCLLSQNAPEDPLKLACQCGMPRPGSYKYTWPNQDIVDAVIVATTTSELREELLATCEKYRYWNGYVSVGCHVLPKTAWLEYLVQLADIDLLEEVLQDPAKVNFTLDAWMLLLKLFNQFYRCKVDKTWAYYCLQCRKTVDQCSLDPPSQPTLTWASLARLLLKSTASKTALELLQSVDIPHNALPGDFYKDCVMSAVVQRHQRNLSNSMLEKIDSYLWSKRVNEMQSSVLYSANKEIKKLVSPTERDAMVYPQQPLNKQNVERLTVSLEDADTHWGTLVQIDSTCRVCGLPLTHSHQQMDGAILIGKCGHTFHKRCLPGKACPVCYSSSR